MTLDGMPYIGPYSCSHKDVYVATGFNKWGMTASMIAADMLSAMVQGKPSLYASLLSPSRSMLRAQLWINAGEAGKNLLTPTRLLDRRVVSD